VICVQIHCSVVSNDYDFIDESLDIAFYATHLFFPHYLRRVRVSVISTTSVGLYLQRRDVPPT